MTMEKINDNCKLEIAKLKIETPNILQFSLKEV